ncbi:MAG: hypothetical protein J6W00_11045 [Lentisphaeria bacterium]|nr:hypothetical protein [Lentisphaeria bacterium]
MSRDFEFERNIMYASKCEFFLNNADIKTLQKALPVVNGENNSMILNRKIEIERDKPAVPEALPMYGFSCHIQGCQPLIKYWTDTNYGCNTEELCPCPYKFPVLNVVADNTFGILPQTLHFARQIGPALGISDQWDDRLMKNAGAWQEARIEQWRYEEAHVSIKNLNQGEVYLVMDNEGFIRHLIMKMYLANSNYILLPLTFAQHPNFPQAMVCHHAFSPDWRLFSPWGVKNLPAEVIISNCWEACTMPCFNTDIIILGYFWGEGMIPHLHLECLHGRKVKILLLKSCNNKIPRQNLLEAILLKSRLKAMDVKADILLAKEETYTAYYYFYRQDILQQSESITTETLVNMGRKFGIDIPENLSPNRFGRLQQISSRTLIGDFAESGNLTAVTIHHGVDINLVTTAILYGILQNENIFPDHWPCKSRIIPECFIISSTVNKHQRLLKQLTPESTFTFHGLDNLKKDGAVKCLNGICHENKSDIFIFSGREIVKEYPKELQEICDWAIKKNKAIVIVTSHDGSASENFIADHAGRDIHIWKSGKDQYEYIIEDRPLLGEKSSFFKAIFSENTWDTASVSDDEIRNITGRNIIRQSIGENGSENTVKMDNYRRS